MYALPTRALFLCLLVLSTFAPARAGQFDAVGILREQNIVYFTRQADANAMYFAAQSGAYLLSRWDALPARYQDALDILVLDETSVPLVDANWVRNRYVSGMTVMVFNVPVETLAELVDDVTLAGGSFAQGYTGDFFVSATRSSRPDGIQGRSSSTSDLTDENDFEDMLNLVAGHRFSLMRDRGG
jgi:hypothetical protein